ncbi:MAG TPA: hypothetical protein VL947_01950, partial [Cytophagales bacterium]|nr:hypothetical protein [Cytophagales bacterium]
GVLVDDLINKGTEEPYRMFTSRAEYRILLRQDNADIRLTEKGHKVGLASDKALRKVKEKITESKKITDWLNSTKVDLPTMNAWLSEMKSAEIKEKTTLLQLLKRPNINIMDFKSINETLRLFIESNTKSYLEQAEIAAKYDSYIEKERQMADKLRAMEDLKMPNNIDYDKFVALSNEAKDKLKKIKPLTLGQASRISGISPSDISIIMIQITK